MPELHQGSNSKTVRRALIVLLVIAGIYLIADHGQHLAPYLPFTFILGCLFMHLFGHGGHKHGGGDRPHEHAGPRDDRRA